MSLAAGNRAARPVTLLERAWFPVNYAAIESLERYHRFYGEDYDIEYPVGSGQRLPLDKVIADLQDRLISLFTKDENGRRP